MIGSLADMLVSPVAHERAARAAGHRPWPLPGRSWVMGQTWKDLVFAHWEVDPAVLEAAIPPELPLDTFEGRAFVGVTPFEVRNVRLRAALPIPWVSAFPEINVRTYVTVDGKPGIWFFSLDAARRLAVATARRAYRLPYFPARMSIARNGAISFTSERTQRDAPSAGFAASYRPAGQIFQAEPGSVEHFLTERYCLYTLDDRRRIRRGEIHHPPWPLQPAEAEIERNTMGTELGLELDASPLLHYASRQDVVFWRLDRAG
jgi:uncharacterized protein YqjF (DUF2071 family)